MSGDVNDPYNFLGGGNLANRYQNFHELHTHEKADVDFRIEMENRASPYSIIAIHGGKIEYGTSVITRAVAGAEFNYYLFEGLKEKGNFSDLHISSHQFDEPMALAMASGSKACVTIHGFKERAQNWVGLGGLNEPLKALIFKNLLATQLLEQTDSNPSGKFPGTDPQNIVNRGQEGGVQIEISYRLRKLLCLYPQHLQRFAKAVQDALHEY